MISFPWWGGENEKWQLVRNPDATVCFVALHSGLALTPKDDSPAAGTALVQRLHERRAIQCWQIRTIGPDAVTVENAVNGLCVTWSQPITTGSYLTLQEPTGAGAQQLRITPVPRYDPAAFHEVVAKHSGKVLDITGGTAATGDGALLQQWTANGGTNQRFRILPTGDGEYALVAEHSGKVLDVIGQSQAAGTRIQQYSAWGGTNQMWRLVAVEAGYVRIESVSSGMVLDVAGISTADGAVVQQYPWVGGDNQRFNLRPHYDLDTTVPHAIIARHSGRCLDVTGGPGATAAGVALQQWEWLHGSNQRFLLQPAADNTYTIKALHSGLLLSMPTTNTQNGALLTQEAADGGDHQRWRLVPVEGPYVEIENVLSGRVLDVQGGPTAVENGTPVQQYDWLSGHNQTWRLSR